MTKPRSKSVSPNKISPAHRKRIERVRDKLQKQGVGRDQAEKEAIDQVVNEMNSGAGGGSNAAGESQKNPQRHGTRTRFGSRR